MPDSTSREMDPEGEIEVTVIFGAAARRGLVGVAIGEASVLLRPAKAREIATFLLEAAGAAEGDEAMMLVLERAGMSDDEAAGFLLALRSVRAAIDQRARREARQAVAYDQYNPDDREEADPRVDPDLRN